jgi:hypothetical protein
MILGSRVQLVHKVVTTSPPSVSELCRKCGALDISQLFRPSLIVMEIALRFTLHS